MSRSFYLLWGSYLVSAVGDWLYLIALPLEVYRLTGSAFQMATVYGVEFIPWILFSMAGGWLADKVNKKRLLIVGHVGSVALVALLCAMLTGDAPPSIPLIYVGVFLLASINPLTHPAFQSTIPSLVKEPHLAKANSWMQLVDGAVGFMGPIIGGSVITALGATNALYLDALSFAVASLLLALIQHQHVRSETKTVGQHFFRKIGADLYAGIQFVGTNKVILFGSTLFFFTNFAFHLLNGSFMYHLKNILQLSPAAIGLTLGLQGIGPIVGAAIAPYLGKKVQAPGRLILSCTVVAGAASLLLLTAHAFWQVALIMALVMACSNINIVTYFTLRQRNVPPDLLGRVVSVTRMISYTSIPLAAFAGGVLLANGFSTYMLIVLAGGIRFAVGVGGFATPLGSGPLKRQSAPALR